MTYKIDPEFAENGVMDTDAVFDALAENGLVDEPLRYKFFNKAINRGDVALNALFDRMPPAVPKDERESSVALNVYSSDSCFASILDSANQVDTGENVSAVYPTKINGVKKILVSVYGSPELVVIDSETMAVDETVDLSSGLPAGTWYVVGFCADGTNAYVVFNTAVRDSVIQAFKMDDWSVASGWPATGTTMPDNSGSYVPVSICNANSSVVAVLTSYYNVTIGASTLLELYDKTDGSLSDSGDGDASPSGTLFPKGLSSNGTYLFFMDGDDHLCSASIANLSTGCGWSNGPLTIDAGTGYYPVACAGKFVVCAGSGTTQPFLYVAHEENALISEITTDDQTVIQKITSVAFDGLSFWAIGIALIDIYPRTFLFKIDVERCLNQDGSNAQSISGSNGIVKPFGISLDDDVMIYSNLISDGRDLWLTGGHSAGIIQKVFRLPLSHFR